MASTQTSLKNKIRHPGKRLPKGPHGGVELLLIQPVEHLGKQGDVVEVKRGFAVNYLIPKDWPRSPPITTSEWWKNTGRNWKPSKRPAWPA